MLTADLRSDTLTRPSEAMRQAMVAAPVGDDVYGEDPTVLALEREVAERLGHEAGLFTPTGSMANQLALRSHAAPGQEILSDDLAHVMRAEMGAAAVLSGITSRTWSAPHGLLEPAEPLGLMAPDAGAYQVSSACVVVENTHNFGGGTVQPLAAMRELYAGAHQAGLGVHLDGARLWNAHIASGVSVAEYGACADTVSVCLSKGLGAPVGSVLVGEKERIAQARVWRKRFGGGMRQVGILAAAGQYALAHHVDRLADDHARAQAAAVAVAAAAPGVIDPKRVETNIVVLDVGAAGWSGADFAGAAAERGVLGYPTDATHARFVWHLDVTDEMSAHAGQVLADLVTQRQPT